MLTAIKTGGILVMCLQLSACATITRGTNDVLQIKSDPSGAEAELSTGHVCTTPCAIKLPRKSELTVDISKPGYQPVEVHVTNEVAGQGGAAMAGNVLVGGVIGAGVDAGTGAMLNLVPNPVEVDLERR